MHERLRPRGAGFPRPPVRAALLGVLTLTCLEARAQCSYPAEVLADSPAAYYRFEETSGALALDSSGHNRHGTFVGGYTPDADGIQDGTSRAACFPGTSFVEVADAVFASAWTALTVEAWVRIAEPTTNFAAMFSSTNMAFVHFQLNSAGNNAVYTSSGELLAPIHPQPSDGVWHHFAFVSASGSTRLFVDGVQYGPAISTTFSFITSATDGYVTMARGFGGGRFLRGCLDEVAIYQSALTPERIAAHFLAGTHSLGVVSQPSIVSTCPSGPAAFSVTAGGSAPFTYQWQWQQVGEPKVWTDLAEGPNADSGGVDRFTATGTTESTVTVSRGKVPDGAVDVIAALRCVVTNACGTVTSDAAALTVCTADFNCDGVVNSTDVSDFINAWFQDQLDGTLVTDWDANGVVNSTDVSEYINSWFDDQAAGCGK